MDVMTAEQSHAWNRKLGEPFSFQEISGQMFQAPELSETGQWINSSKLSMEELRGQVVVVTFWVRECINCDRNLKHCVSWHQDYSDKPVTVIGIHTPETPADKDIVSVREAVVEHNIDFPVLVDNSMENWNAWTNRFWPSVYIIDKKGHVRYWWYGEMNFGDNRGEEIMRRNIQKLLLEKD
jgi:peroxiredoxin